ncbi:hypothetical protein [Myceligenerans xiligouense]|uniref:Lipoprotein n=1 Tax=Myceligenerans xiligouense TaxID=253184 RepID=A0A3N4YRL6_9MICO|nr:hypothetical protein [Myceligenerans xiligouense]RPF22196.1 hypothetical protein EDD34_2844 [Myceligenerans xiligouense]
MARKSARRASGALVALTLVITAACTASTGDAEPAMSPARPVTVSESRLLADVRTRNAEAGSRAITARYTDQGREMKLAGWFDYTTRTGYGMVSADGLASDRVAWNRELVATSGRGGMGKPLTSLDGWTAAPLDPSGSPLAVVLAVLAGLGAERPDDAALIRTGGALWLREDETGGRSVTVFAGPTPVPADGGRDHDTGTLRDARDARGGLSSEGDPDQDDAASTPETGPKGSPIRYWVDDGGLAHRVDVRLGDEWAEVTLQNDDVPVPPLLADIDLTAKGGTTTTDTAPKDGG